MPIQLTIAGGPYVGVSRVDIARRLHAMMTAVQMERAELSVLLTDDEQIKELNRIYRKKNRPTDVLAFAQQEGMVGGRADLLGDVIVSIPTAIRQARSSGRDVVAEVTMLLAHGLLHLLGWDHETPVEDARMRRETERLCAVAVSAQTRPGQPVRRKVKGWTESNANADSSPRRAGRTAR